MNQPHNVIMDIIDIYWDDPVAFAEDMLGFYPDEHQAPILKDLATDPMVTVRSGQGIGKTGIEAVAVLWFLTCRPSPRVVCTAPTRQQLNDVLWSEIAKWLESSKVDKLLRWTKTKVYMVGHEKRWFATARTATKPENMQGFHEDYMLFIVDEASGVEDRIMETILGTLSGDENKLLMCGNPTKTNGTFYDSHHKDRSSYKTHKISSRDSARTNKKTISLLERKYGKDSDVVRVRVDGEFPKSEPDTFIALEYVEKAAMHDVYPTEVTDKKSGKWRFVIPSDAKIQIGVDVARFGDDQSVIVPRIGNHVPYFDWHIGQDTTVTTGKIIQTARDMMRTYGINQCTVKVDDDGVGGGVTDQLRESIREQRLYITVVGCHNGAAAENEDNYDNWGTESWAHIRDLLHDEAISIPNDEDMIGQLSTRKYTVTSKGKIRIERKEDMKKRGLASPDRADALVLAFVPTPGLMDDDSAALLRGVRIYG